MEKKEEFELDLVGFFYYLRKKLLIVVIAALLSALIGLLVTAFIIPTEYTASTRSYVLNRSDESAVAYSDIQLSSQLLNDYKVLITGRNVTQEVIDDLDLKFTTGQLAQMIHVSAPDNTRVVQISVVDTDPQRAADIANAVCSTASEQIQAIMAVDAVKTVYEAVVPTQPSSPNMGNNLLLSFFIGLLGTVIVMFIVYVLDDSIRTEEDVERYLGLSTLGVIPMSQSLGNVKKSPRKLFPFRRKK